MARLILGHTTDDSIRIWVRASSRWPVAFVDVLDSADRRTAPTKVVQTQEAEFYTSVVDWRGLAADSPYRVKVAFGKERNNAPDERIRAAYTEGRFRTFTSPSAQDPFCFMLGSCNLHSLGIFERPDRAWMKISQLAEQNQARFMIHAGDQIYADIPLKPSISLAHYREKYLDAWDDCTPARKVLTELPHYMILDDHEITNNFDNDLPGNADYQGLSRVAMKVYWEFQHSHNPQCSLPGYHYHYDFSYGRARFFVMDTRYYRASTRGQMLDIDQELALLDWLVAHRNALKFVVTSVPFVTEVRNPGTDKWCARAYDGQRGRILRHILDNEIEKLVFLTGDMHASLYSRMEVADAAGKKAIIHELMSSPINQITPEWPVDRQFDPAPATREITEGLTIASRIDRSSYLGKHSNVMAIEVQADGDVGYRIYQTSSKQKKPLRYRSFTP
jgi:alkaline phosphatase D